METGEIIVGLDIGTTKICVMVGRKNEFGKVEILGMGKSESLGVMRGVVANIEKTVNSIKKAVAEAEQNSGCEIKDVFVGIAGQHIKSLQNRGTLTRTDRDGEISKQDVEDIKSDMFNMLMQPGEEIIDVYPQEYIVDNEQGIKDPVGMSGVRLEANCHIITGLISAVRNIQKCVKKAGLNPVNLELEPLASAEAVLSEDEKEAGVVLVDIGGGTTDIAIFQDNIIRHTAVIPYGGNVITDDIKQGCTIIKLQAEQLKVKYGSALANPMRDNEVVSIPGLRGRNPKEVSVKNLAHIIQARMEEIIENIDYEIQSSGFAKDLIVGIVVTGGGSQLKHLNQLIQYKTGMDCRIGLPNEHLGKGADYIKSPMFSTGVGLVINGIAYKEALASQPSEPIEEPEKTVRRPRSNFFRKIFDELVADDSDDKNL
jgi:cell division protein FtsA